MRKTLASVFALLASYGLLLLGNGLFTSLIGVRTKIEDFPNPVIGAIAAAYFFGLLVGARFTVRVVWAVGHIRAFAVFASLMSVAALGHPLFVDPMAWALLRVLAGFSMAGMTLVTESWLNERCSNANRGRVLALYMITNYAAAGCGQYLLPVADPAGFKLFSLASILYSLAVLPVLLTRATAPPPVEPERLGFTALWRVSPLGLTGAMCAGLANSSINGMGAVYARELGLSITDTATFMASLVAGGLLLQWPLGRLSDRVDRRHVLVGVALVSSVVAAAMALFGSHLGSWLFVAGAVYGGISFTLYSVCTAHTNDFAPAEQRVATASGLLMAYAVGASIGPLVAGTVMVPAGPGGLFIWTAAVFALLAVFTLWRMTRRRTFGPQGPAISLPGGQFTAGQLYSSLRNQMDRDLAHMSGGPSPARRGGSERSDF